MIVLEAVPQVDTLARVLRGAQALARWLFALLGVLALATTVLTAVPESPCDSDGTARLVDDRSGPETLGVDVDLSRDASEGRDEDERDEEDESDSDELALRPGVISPRGLRLAAAARVPMGQGHTHGSDRAAHRGKPERPPHA